MPSCRVYLKAQEQERLQRAAAKLNMTISTLIKQCLEEGLRLVENAANPEKSPLAPPKDGAMGLVHQQVSLAVLQQHVYELQGTVRTMQERLRAIETKALEEMVLHHVRSTD